MLEYPEPKNQEPLNSNTDYKKRQQLQTLVEQFYSRAQEKANAPIEEKWVLVDGFTLGCKKLGYSVDQRAVVEAMWGTDHSIQRLLHTLVLNEYASPPLSTHHPDVNPVEAAKKDFEQEPETAMIHQEVQPTIDLRKTQASTFEMPSIRRLGIRKWFGIALGLVEFKFDQQHSPADKVRNAR